MISLGYLQKLFLGFFSGTSVISSERRSDHSLLSGFHILEAEYPLRMSETRFCTIYSAQHSSALLPDSVLASPRIFLPNFLLDLSKRSYRLFRRIFLLPPPGITKSSLQSLFRDFSWIFSRNLFHLFLPKSLCYSFPNFFSRFIPPFFLFTVSVPLNFFFNSSQNIWNIFR